MNEESTEFNGVEPIESLSKALQWATNPRGGNNFYGRILNGAGRKAEPGLGTCAVKITNKGQYALIWDPDWFVKQPKAFQLIILVHEAAHLVLGHLERHLKLIQRIKDPLQVARGQGYALSLRGWGGCGIPGAAAGSCPGSGGRLLPG